jgi:hypothetical protein
VHKGEPYVEVEKKKMVNQALCGRNLGFTLSVCLRAYGTSIVLVLDWV